MWSRRVPGVCASQLGCPTMACVFLDSLACGCSESFECPGYLAFPSKKMFGEEGAPVVGR